MTPQQRIFRVVSGAVMNAKHGHKDWKITRVMALSIAKRASVFERARVKGYDNTTVAEWIKENRHLQLQKNRYLYDDTSVLKMLEGHGVVVGYFRKVIQDECDAHKRNAKVVDDGRFLIVGPSAPYVVGRSGYVLTTLSRRYMIDVFWPMVRRQRAMVSA